MSSVRKLASQTAVYGLSSILGRFLNYLLVPLHTAQFSPEQYGIITELYAYVAFLVVLLTYGMETAYFRYSSKTNQNSKVFSTTLWSLFVTTAAFWSLAIVFKQPFADWLKYPNHSEYVVWFAFIVGLDAITSIPLAKMRQENKALKFAFVNLGNVVINIGLNLFFLAYCMPKFNAGESNWLIETFYSADIGVGYVFISNLVASGFKFLAVAHYFPALKDGWNSSLFKALIIYGGPLLIAGLAGIINETLDRILLKRLLFDALGAVKTMEQIGIYGAVYKISIIITLFIQAFRYAAEPFFFSEEKSLGAKKTYAKVLNVFVGVLAIVFLGVMTYIDVIKLFIRSEAYYVGLSVVPVLLFANIFLGIYYNLSIWYKLSEQTRFGAYIAIFGAIITIIINLVFIPIYGFVGSAWGTFICYFSMMAVSFYLGNKHYPIQYNIKRVFCYLIISFLFWQFSTILSTDNFWLNWLFRNVLLTLFILFVFLTENNRIKYLNLPQNGEN